MPMLSCWLQACFARVFTRKIVIRICRCSLKALWRTVNCNVGVYRPRWYVLSHPRTCTRAQLSNDIASFDIGTIKSLDLLHPKAERKPKCRFREFECCQRHREQIANARCPLEKCYDSTLNPSLQVASSLACCRTIISCSRCPLLHDAPTPLHHVPDLQMRERQCGGCIHQRDVGGNVICLRDAWFVQCGLARLACKARIMRHGKLWLSLPFSANQARTKTEADSLVMHAC